MSDTIYALASGTGTAGVAVIRVSGPAAGPSIEQLTGQAPPPPRMASLRRFRDPGGGDGGGNDIDEGITLWFPGPASFTGENIAEFHVHGGVAVIEALISALSVVDGCRLAEPGEFTRRAFENGKLDLTSAEAVADLVAAETVAQRRQALGQYDGALAALYDNWRTQLTTLLAHAETTIDFADEDLPEDTYAKMEHNILYIRDIISQHIDDQHRGERIRSGFHVAIIGAPNVGKSSLLNRLAAREAAIVSEAAGTTRDVIEVHMHLGGYAVIVADTAGIREAEGAVEAEGVRRARHSADEADLRLVVFDAAALPALDPFALDYVDDHAIAVLNKTDIADTALPAAIAGRPTCPVSAKTGDGLEALLAAITAQVQVRLAASEQPPLTRARHREALVAGVAALGRASTATLPELAAEDIRIAVRSLGRITGRVDVEDVLDVIFHDFCIGK
ncbi:MAG: tRNA uridine-5-carboxymethylaminomethyl(34) synthesis GTPase MnmE [Alphaproteobacteria bacterium]|nr:tRNA uridine-5-carboxymethylaminomethyl(34) synthesis GTPase MnmE [Alphaproteobacteria bacterium]